MGWKELSHTFNPVQFLLLHDNETAEGKLDWLKFSSRIVGIGFIYTSMVLGPYFLSQWLLPQTDFLLSLTIYLAIVASFPLFNVIAHDLYNLTAKFLQFGLLTLEIPKVNKEKEIVISTAELAPHFGAGKAKELAPAVREVLGDPKTSNQLEKKLGKEKKSFSLFLRRNGPSTVWSIRREEKDKFADFFGVIDIPEINKEKELAISTAELAPYFTHKKDLEIFKRMKKQLGEPGKDKEKIIETEKNKFSLFLRTSGSNVVWSIKKEDIYKFSSYIGEKIYTLVIPKIDKENEISISELGLTPYFGAGQSKNLPKKIDSELGKKPKDFRELDQIEKMLETGKNKFLLSLRMSGSSLVWSIRKEDKVKFSDFFGLEIKETSHEFKIPKLNKEEEVSVGSPEFFIYFGSGKKGRSLPKKISEELGLPEESGELEKKLGKDKNQFSFS